MKKIKRAKSIQKFVEKQIKATLKDGYLSTPITDKTKQSIAKTINNYLLNLRDAGLIKHFNELKITLSDSGDIELIYNVSFF